MTRQKLKINPLALKWLRKEFQLDEAEMAKKMGVKAERYTLMENGSLSPSLNQLRKLSRSTKIPLMAFYLKTLPDGKPFPTDYRKRTDSPLDVRSIRAVRRGYLIQNLMSTFDDWQETKLRTLEGRQPSEASQILRSICSYSPSNAISKDSLFNKLRDTIESFGIITLVLSFNKKEMRGFSLTGQPSVIAVAAADAKASQIFTLLHELFHIIHRQDSICQPLTQGLGATEAKCNKFAADFLLTPGELQVALREDNSREDNNLRRIADQHKTSREVLLIRMIEGGLATWDDYELKSSIWQKEYQKQDEDAFYPQADPIKKVWRENGRGVTLKILEQLDNAHITQSDAAHYLNAKASYIDFVSEGSMGKV